jgi:hypothetical protein
MGYGVVISSNNYVGQLANITYYPDTGSTIYLGANVLPHTFNLDYYFGVYELYFSDFDTTCYVYYNNPDTNYLLQENFFTLDQEDNSKILIT